MITLEEALKIISNLEISRNSIDKPIMEALGCILAEEVFSDINMPPFNKSAMDGYACRHADLNQALEVLEFISAGILPTKEITTGTCSKIMTGAKVPKGADCVIMVEHTTIDNNGKIIFQKESSKKNICFLGEDVHKGDKVLEKGIKITPAVIAVAASVGKKQLKVYAPPSVAVIATGDELVEPDIYPDGPFIRNSNAYNLQAQISSTGACVNYMGIISDDKVILEKAISKALNENTILILTGGVSMGDKDYVPEILEACGLTMIFQKMAIQPGKPVAFAHGKGKYCFGLSGNPVSSMLQFELIVRPFIFHSMGLKYQLPIVPLPLDKPKSRNQIVRQQFFPVKIKNGMAKLIDFHGSAHIAGMVGAHGMAIFPIGENELKKGQVVDVLLLN